MVATTKKIGGSKNGGSRVVEDVKAPKFYPADDIPELVSKGVSGKRNEARSKAGKEGVAKLRGSITPGTVLILLAGRFRGRRCVFLKQLAKGLLLVSGPYCVNGVPLRRVNQSYCIATSTKVDVSGVDCQKYDDAYFGKPKGPKRVKKDGKDFMEEEPKASSGPTDARKADQKTIDAAMMKGIGKKPMMDKYLKARFTLSKGQKPHKMIF